VNKTATSASKLARCILIHAYTHVQLASSRMREKKRNFMAYLTSWHNSIFGSKLRTD